MFLIVGLSNPGKEYEGTRHSVGREIVETISRNAECRMQNAEWRISKSLQAETLECTIVDHRVVLAKPTTYMNESGRAAAALAKKYALDLSKGSDLIVIHDDLDLSLGTLRLSTGGSSGGHKGVQSIIDALGTKDFLRLRIGIGPNATPEGVRIPAEDFVLKKFQKENERLLIAAAVAHAAETIVTLLRDGLPAAQRFAPLPTGH